MRFRSRHTFERIFNFRVLGKGDANLGVTWHWHIQQYVKGEMRARPLVQAIEPDSPAAKAGLKVGDIVCYVDGKELPRQDGIPTLRALLRKATPGTKMIFTVRSVKLQDKRFTSALSPSREVTISIHDTQKGLREAEDGEFEEWYANLKKLYERQIIVTELIAKNDVAIGMTLDEVKKSLGEPTETEVKQTRQGESGKWDFVVTEEQKHYSLVRDPHTGSTYRQLSHVTTEEISRTTIEFENSTITSVTRKRNNGPNKVRIISAPIVFH